MWLWSYMAAVLLAGAAQAVLPSPAWLGGARPPFLLAVSLYYALTRSGTATLWTALAAGLMQDALGAVPLGYSSFCFAVAGLLVNRYRDDLFPEMAVTHALLGAGAAAGVSLTLYALLRAAEQVALTPGQLLLKLAGATLLGALVTPPVCAALARMDAGLGLAAEDAP